MRDLQAAIELIRASDAMRLLHAAQRASGRQFVRNADTYRVEAAVWQYAGGDTKPRRVAKYDNAASRR